MKKNYIYESVSKLPPFELELILAHILKKSREYVLAHPEIGLSKAQKNRFNRLIKRRQNHEPLAYILGHKEFYALDFKVTKNTLIPRPETEMLVELATNNLGHGTWSKNNNAMFFVDIGTGSGNIIVSIAHNMEHGAWNKNSERRKEIFFYGVDISSKALAVAKYNAKKNQIDKKIKFIKSDILEYFINHFSTFPVSCSMTIVANLPYLSKAIYDATTPDVKNFEPRSALFSNKNGLAHYEKLLKQIKQLKKKYSLLQVVCFVEFSPEQKLFLAKLIKKYFPEAGIKFHRDLAGKWRVAEIKS